MEHEYFMYTVNPHVIAVYFWSEDAESDKDCPDDKFDVKYKDTFSILEQDNGLEYQLLTHKKCACNLLNLLPQQMLTEQSSDTHKRLSHAGFGKCQAMWNKSGHSHIAAEVVEDKCSLQLIRPNNTQWNSTYMAVERVMRIIQEQGEDVIRGVCEELKQKFFFAFEKYYIELISICNITFVVIHDH